MRIRLKYTGKAPIRFGDRLLEKGDVVNVLPAMAQELLAGDFQKVAAASKKRAKKTTKRNGKG